MSELGDDARALLDSVRDADDPSARDRARVHGRLNAAIAAAAAGAAASGASVATASTATTSTAASVTTQLGAAAKLGAAVQGAASAAAGAKVGAVIAIAAIGAASGALYRYAPAPAPHAQPAQAQHAIASPRARTAQHAHDKRDPIAPVPEAAPAIAALAAAAPQPIAAPIDRARPTARVRPRAPAPIARASEPSALQAELELLSSAQVALRGDDPERAIALLADHATRFPSGVLALERDTARAIALCDAGRVDQGRAAAQAILQDAPQSPLAARLKRACDQKP